MIRITVVSQTSEEVTLKIEGWVTYADVELMKEEITRWFREVHRVVLNLTHVRFIDEAGIEMLCGWPRSELVLQGGSPFVRTLLQDHGL